LGEGLRLLDPAAFASPSVRRQHQNELAATFSRRLSKWSVLLRRLLQLEGSDQLSKPKNANNINNLVAPVGEFANLSTARTYMFQPQKSAPQDFKGVWEKFQPDRRSSSGWWRGAQAGRWRICGV
jgi:hypothetical protein